MAIVDMSIVQMLKTLNGFLMEIDSVLVSDYITYFQLSAIKSDIQSYIRKSRRENNLNSTANEALITLYNNMIDNTASKSNSKGILGKLFGRRKSKHEHHHDPVFCKNEIIKIREEIQRIIVRFSQENSELFSSNSG